MSDNLSNEASVDAQQQWKPTKPTDDETKAEIRKVFAQAAAENNITDEARIEDAVEEMFVMMKKSFG